MTYIMTRYDDKCPWRLVYTDPSERNIMTFQTKTYAVRYGLEKYGKGRFEVLEQVQYHEDIEVRQ
jgi:hypothetical protein